LGNKIKENLKFNLTLKLHLTTYKNRKNFKMPKSYLEKLATALEREKN
jgi:hypothetical protein